MAPAEIQHNIPSRHVVVREGEHMDRYQELTSHASACIKAEHWVEALPIMEELTRLWPESHVMAYNRALIHWRLGDLHAAETWLRHAITLRHEYEAATHALQHLTTDLHADYLARIADALRHEAWADAGRLLDEMNVRWPEDPQALYLRAMALRGVGQLSEAHEVLQRVLALDPTHDEARTALAALQQVLQETAEPPAAPLAAPSLVTEDPRALTPVIGAHINRSDGHEDIIFTLPGVVPQRDEADRGLIPPPGVISVAPSTFLRAKGMSRPAESSRPAERDEHTDLLTTQKNVV